MVWGGGVDVQWEPRGREMCHSFWRISKGFLEEVVELGLERLVVFSRQKWGGVQEMVIPGRGALVRRETLGALYCLKGQAKLCMAAADT